MRPVNLSTKIFLDSGNPAETRRAIVALGFLDGQTTNPSLVAKNPEVQARLARGEQFRREELLEQYRVIVAEMSGLIPSGSVSVEVYADRASTPDELLRQATRMFAWAPNVHVKLPITAAGLAAAERGVPRGMRVNMTLCFGQAQAAAVHAATKGARKGDVFVSPFVGRLDDHGVDGMSLIGNILAMYRAAGSHVQTLVASVRSLDHLQKAFVLKAPIVTAPLAVLEAWAADGCAVREPPQWNGLPTILFKDMNCAAHEWDRYDLRHELTDIGLDRFAADWNALIAD